MRRFSQRSKAGWTQQHASRNQTPKTSKQPTAHRRELGNIQSCQKPKGTLNKESVTPSPPKIYRGSITTATGYVEACSVGEEARREGSNDNTDTKEPKGWGEVLRTRGYCTRISLFELYCLVSSVMAPNLASSQHDLIQDMILDKKLKTWQMTNVTECSERLIKAIRSNIHYYRTIKAPPNIGRRSRSIMPM